RPRYSPVHGERLGTVNADGTCYRTRSEALDQCAFDLVELARTVYWIDLTAQRPLSVRDAANTFAASAGAGCSASTTRRPWSSRTQWPASPRTTAACAGPRSPNRTHPTGRAAGSGSRSVRSHPDRPQLPRHGLAAHCRRHEVPDKKVDRVTRLLLSLLRLLAANWPAAQGAFRGRGAGQYRRLVPAAAEGGYGPVG